ncbi:MAG: AMP-binding protein [Candidatus Omnitrophica bacterium]|nr:AMP-binding protein [Candidatus Omnitrophota bacterium]
MNPWNNISSLSYKQIKEYQNHQLNSFINTHVYPFSSHYRQVFDDHKINPKHIKTIADLKHLPFTSKLDLMTKENPQKFRDFVLAPDQNKIRQFWPKTKLLQMALQSTFRGKESVLDALGKEYRPIFMTFTTGTTNAPVPFIYSRYDIDNLNLSGSRMVHLFNIKSDEKIMNIFPFAPHLAFWQTFFGALEANIFALSTGGGKVMGTEGNFTALMRTKPSVILGVPSYIYHLVRYAQKRQENLSFIKKIVLGASKVTVEYKFKLAEMLRDCGAHHVLIFGTYGFTEARTAWAECPTENHISSGYHLYPDKEIFEIVDPQTGEIKKEGEDGELIYTSIDSRASVVLRYRTGDFVKGGIIHEPCPHCGLMTLRISSDISRLSDTKDLNLSKIKGMLVNLNHFAEVLNNLPEIDEWQLEIRKHNNDPYDSDEIIIYIPPKGLVNESSFSVMLKDKLVATTELAPNEIKFVPLSEMIQRLELETANKEKRILDSRPKL